MIISALTLEELLAVLDDISCEYELYEGEVDGFCWIDCDLFGAEFIIFPWGPGPFYQDFSLEAIRPAELDPETMCTLFNKKHSFARVSLFNQALMYKFDGTYVDTTSRLRDNKQINFSR